MREGSLTEHRRETRELGLELVERELTKAGWIVEHTVAQAPPAHRYAVSQDRRIIQPLKIRVNGRKPEDTSLGLEPEKRPGPWWVIVVHARTDHPTCYLFTREELLELGARDNGKRTGKPENERLFWLHKRYFTPGGESEYLPARNGWARLGDPRGLN